MDFQYSYKPEVTAAKSLSPSDSKQEPEPIDSDLARIIFSCQELTFDFIHKEKVITRIVTTPEYAKKLCQNLLEEIAGYEAIHGSILLPKQKRESLTSEIKRNLYRNRKVGKNLRIINSSRMKSEVKKKNK
ncbi:MAG: hypothetical protein B6244_13015 [Candidatus Cloacimonetes bacterium 4572_55]|nr:MAG: hypothetical protein B6244_13015 [Candidatus Cloacimonetes bacterium 4572_55]